MRMINELTAAALDSQKFVDRLMACEAEQVASVHEEHMRQQGENRTQRRARERAEAKLARKQKVRG